MAVQTSTRIMLAVVFAQKFSSRKECEDFRTIWQTDHFKTNESRACSLMALGAASVDLKKHFQKV